MKDYVKEFQKRIEHIDSDAKSIHIINAGSMNHGKSSLLNSLLDSDYFQEQDIRTTIENSEKNWFNDVYLVDTPGLNAEMVDDIKAYEAYRRANMIVFCHTIGVGELHEAEIKAINAMKSLFESEQDFWEHFCLVFTFLDSNTEDNVEIVKNKALSDIAQYCGGANINNFTVSNSRYKKGRTENKPGLVNKSGIPVLREFLKSQCEKWRGENNRLRALRIHREKEDLLKEMYREKKKINDIISSKKSDIENKQNYFFMTLRTVIGQKESDNQTLKGMKKVLKNLKRDLSDLKAQHNRESY